MENKTQTKINVITIAGMIKHFGISRSTIYKKYKPKLTEIPTTDQKVYFNYEEAKKLHEKLKKGTENFNVIA